ncbi:MAG TPA: hypothetical protein VEQ35_02455 [Beijerinckia sp.]|nr:hypothetical protein [Beijerinckia sp.]
MKPLPLSLAFAFVLVLPAAGGEVPFAEPPAPSPLEPNTYVPSLGDIMGATQLRHIKLGNAISSKNWKLVDYELGQIRASFNNAVILYRNIPVEYIIAVNEPLNILQDAAKSKDAIKSAHAFADLTKACNNCHQAAQVGFIEIQSPTSFPFVDQKFSPPEK